MLNNEMAKRGLQIVFSLVGIGVCLAYIIIGCQSLNGDIFDLGLKEEAPIEEEGGGVEVSEVEAEGDDEVDDTETYTEEVEFQLPELAVSPVLIEPATLQEVIEIWLASYRHGDVGIEIIDANTGVSVASYQAYSKMRPRSLYKLFYYYDAYAQVDAGVDDLNQEYADGKTLGACLDAIIRSSNNPCAEKMYNDPARSARVAQLIQRLGLNSTQADGLMTSAHDVAILLQYYYAHPEWSEGTWQKFRESALNQPYAYRKGLPSGFTAAAVYDKVGWGTDEAGVAVYNDAAMVELGGQRYIVVVMTTQTDYTALRALGAMLEQVMLKIRSTGA